MSRVYLGYMFQGGNRGCTIGTPNKKTGSYSIDGESFSFSIKEKRDDWLSKENPSEGERICVTKGQLRKLCLGDSVETFNRHFYLLTVYRVNDYEKKHLYYPALYL